MAVVYPLGNMTTLLMNDVKDANGKTQYSGVVDAFKKTLKSEGAQAMYKGFLASFVGVFVYRGMHHALLEFLKSRISPSTACIVSTVAAGLTSYPLDTVRSRMVSAKHDAAKAGSIVLCVKKIVEEEGALALLKGYEASV